MLATALAVLVLGGGPFDGGPTAHTGPPAPAAEGAARPSVTDDCRTRDFAALRRNPSRDELRCRYGVSGPGRFGLLSYADVPVYQPATPMPGTHMVGLPGHARPHLFESYEQWEWRVLRTEYGSEVHRIHRDLESLDPEVADRIRRLEDGLTREGIRFNRRETWRSPTRQAYLFQQGRSRPGPLATATLTSWHAQVDGMGRPAGRAVDYDVAGRDMIRFHEIAAEVGLSSFGHDSNDPGHVFLPDPRELAPGELALLRTLPRVPEVTLATGLPTDRRLPEGGRPALREASLAFASDPFIPYPVARVTWQRPGVRAVPFAHEPANLAMGAARREASVSTSPEPAAGGR